MKFSSTVRSGTLFGALAQLGERNTGSVEVSGSIPLGSTILFSSLLFSATTLIRLVIPVVMVMGGVYDVSLR